MTGCNEQFPYVFVSYSHKDTERVVAIMEHLCAQGFNVWYDDGIDPGTEWADNIAMHVEQCSYFLAFVSEGYVNSKNCRDELDFARDLDKPQLLVYLEDVVLPRGMAMRMNRIQSIYWNRYLNNPNGAFEKLFSAKGIEVARVNPPLMQNAYAEDSYTSNQNYSAFYQDNVNEDDEKSERKIRKAPIIASLISIVAVVTVVVMVVTGKKNEVAPIDADPIKGIKVDVEKNTEELGTFYQIDVSNVSHMGNMAVNQNVIVSSDSEGIYVKQPGSEELLQVFDFYGYSFNIVGKNLIFIDESQKVCICDLDGSNLTYVKGLESVCADRVWANKNGCFIRLSSKDTHYQDTLAYASFSNPGKLKIIGSMEGYSLAMVGERAYFFADGGTVVKSVNLNNLNEVTDDIVYEGTHYGVDMVGDGNYLYLLNGDFKDSSFVQTQRLDVYSGESTETDHSFNPQCYPVSFALYGDNAFLSVNRLDGAGGYLFYGSLKKVFTENSENPMQVIYGTNTYDDIMKVGYVGVDPYYDYVYIGYNDFEYNSQWLWYNMGH